MQFKTIDYKTSDADRILAAYGTEQVVADVLTEFLSGRVEFIEMQADIQAAKQARTPIEKPPAGITAAVDK